MTSERPIWKKRLLSAIVWFFMTILGFIMFMGIVVSLQEWRNFPAQPTPLTLGASVEQLQVKKKIFVEITDAHWICASIEYVSRNRSGTETHIVFANTDHDILVFATFNNERSCQELQSQPLIGEIRLTEGKYEGYFVAGVFYNIQREIRHGKNIKVLEFCSSCNKSSAGVGAALSIVMPIILIGIFVFAHMKDKQQKQLNASPPSPTS